MNGKSRTALLAAAFLLYALTPVGADLIKFKSGRTITGKIVAEDENQITIEMEGGGNVSFPRSMIDQVLRDDTGDAEHPERPDSVLRKESFFFWNGDRRLGSREVKVVKREQGGLQLEETILFVNDVGEKDVEVHSVEIVSGSLEPLQISYRVVTGDTARSLHGVVYGSELRVTKSGGGSREESTITIPEGMRFPLSAREFAIRNRDTVKGEVVIPVFDPREDNFFKFTFEMAPKRKVDWEGALTEVTVIKRTRGSRPTEEIWVDGSGVAITEELNGAELVAVRTTAERVDAFREGKTVEPTKDEERVRPVVENQKAGFRIRKPNIAWSVKPRSEGDSPDKVLSLENLRWFASVDFWARDGVPDGGLLASLAVDMERMFKAGSEDFEKISGGYFDVGGVRAYRMVATSRNKGEMLQSLIVGFLKDDRTWMIAMGSPVKYWKGALPEFEAILGSFEFTE